VSTHADIDPNGPNEDWQFDWSSDTDPKSGPEMEMAEFDWGVWHVWRIQSRNRVW
jgi:hypothetical protein